MEEGRGCYYVPSAEATSRSMEIYPPSNPLRTPCRTSSSQSRKRRFLSSSKNSEREDKTLWVDNNFLFSIFFFLSIFSNFIIFQIFLYFLWKKDFELPAEEKFNVEWCRIFVEDDSYKCLKCLIVEDIFQRQKIYTIKWENIPHCTLKTPSCPYLEIWWI